jgi:hypothetical protein
MDTTNETENSHGFNCNYCNYTCSKNSDMKKHCLTIKHLKREKEYNMDTKNTTPNFYICDCGKKYIYHSGLWKHKQNCNYSATNSPCGDKINCDPEDNKNSEEFLHSDKTDKELILLLLKQNNDLQNKVLEICKTSSITNNNNNNITNTNSHNKAFNLNFFLNETCKNAMNITDFVDSIKLQLSDLENVAKIGYVEGLSKIIIKNLNALDVTERPVHCSDSKRDTMYVKDEDKWEKESEDNHKVLKAIEDIADKNRKMVKEWKTKNPECASSKSHKADVYSHIMIQAVCSNNDANNNKILKKIAKEVTIDKNKKL